MNLNISQPAGSVSFKSTKSAGVATLFLSIVILLVAIVLISPGSGTEHPGVIICVSIVIAFLAWIWFDTVYTLDGSFLQYRSGPFRGKIKITSIHEVVCTPAPWHGFRPALDTKGLMIKHGRWNEIYITPSHQSAFIGQIRMMNPKVVVKEQAAV